LPYKTEGWANGLAFCFMRAIPHSLFISSAANKDARRGGTCDLLLFKGVGAFFCQSNGGIA